MPGELLRGLSSALLDLAASDERIVAITAHARTYGSSRVQDRFPKRFIDVGIAEQHAFTAAAGMAMAGLRPVVAVYSTFSAERSTSGTSTSGFMDCRGHLRRPGGGDRG